MPRMRVYGHKIHFLVPEETKRYYHDSGSNIKNTTAIFSDGLINTSEQNATIHGKVRISQDRHSGDVSLFYAGTSKKITNPAWGSHLDFMNEINEVLKQVGATHRLLKVIAH